MYATNTQPDAQNHVGDDPRCILFLRNSRGITDITGAETYLLTLLNGLQNGGCRVHLLCADIAEKGETPWLAALRERGIPHEIIDVPSKFSRQDFSAARRAIDRLQPDVVHAMDHRADAVAVWLQLRTGVPAVASFFGWTNWARGSLRARLYPVFDRLVMRRLRKVIVDSEHVGELLRSTAPQAQVTVIQNGVDLARFDADRITGGYKSQWFGSEATTLVGMIGRLHPVKGHADMIDAAARLAPDHPQLRWVVLGDPPSGYEAYAQSLRDRIAAAGLTDRFVITNLPSSEIPSAIASFDITAIPSHMESLSYVMLESMALRVPVLSTRVGGHGDLICDGQNGLLVDPGDVEGLCASVVRLMGDPEAARAMGLAGFETVKAGYSTEGMIARTCAVYDEVMR